MKTLFFLSLVLPVTAFASSVDCPNAVNQVIRTLGVSDTDGTGGVAPNSQAMRTYSDPAKQIKIEASAAGDSWSWIEATIGSDGHDLELSYSGCQLSVIVSNHYRDNGYGQTRQDQTSCSAQFCRNLNAGLTPEPLDDQFLEFKDGSGNIGSWQLEGTKAMCQAAANYL